MRRIFAAAAIAALMSVAGAASATTFTGSYTPNVYGDGAGEPDNGGLVIETDDTTVGGGTGFTFNLTGNGSSTNVNLFKIYTDEDHVDNDDEIHRTISVLFNFTAPGAANGTVGGQTWAIDGTVNKGHVSWNGPAVINFGGGFGSLTVTLNDADFNAYDPSRWEDPDQLGNGKAQITGNFVLSNVGGAVPEPASWAMMITGFGLAGATLRRRRTAAVAA
jgi:hypothetical protein